MSLVQDIRKDIFESSKQRHIQRVDILKMVLAEIKNEEISKGETLSEDQVLKILRRQKKRVQDSISQFKKMEREDLVSKEMSQLEVLDEYLPVLMSEEDILTVVKDIVTKTGASSLKDMGKVMGMTMQELNGKAEGGVVKKIVEKLLS
jgi:uncharacterized protein